MAVFADHTNKMNRLFLPVLVLALAGLSCAEVGVVVELPNGSIIPRCVSVPDGSSAYRILRSTGLETEWSDDGPWGRALCKIEGVGSEPVGTACSDWNSYWAFSLSLNRSDGWTCHSPVGFTAGGCWNRDYRTPSYEGHYCARDGDVLGFHFTDNFPSGYPEFLSFADICGEKPNRGPVQKKILQSSRPFWRRYAEDCGIEYTDRIPPQNLARRCREHRAEQQKAEEFSQKNNTDIIAEGFGGSSLRGVEYDTTPKS